MGDESETMHCLTAKDTERILCVHLLGQQDIRGCASVPGRGAIKRGRVP